MGFKAGRHYVVSGCRLMDGAKVYLEYGSKSSSDTAEIRVARAIKELNRVKGTGYSTRDDYELRKANERLDDARKVLSSDNPFEVFIWDIDTDPVKLARQLQSIQYLAIYNNLIPSSIELEIVNVSFEVVDPKSDPELELALRKVALEKLTEAEKQMLNVKHWEVYNKLADRTGLDDEVA